MKLIMLKVTSKCSSRNIKKNENRPTDENLLFPFFTSLTFDTK